MNKLFVQLLKVRGLSEDFLAPKYENLSNPLELPDMKKAVKRIISALETQEKILIYGDYDVDGVTSTAILFKTLKLLGVKNILTMLPDRFVDGYGMSTRLIERAKAEQIGLVITVDCGSNNPEIVEELSQNGIDTIVTDHHEISGKLPKAVAVVNPKRPDFRKKILKRQAEIAEGKPGLHDIAGLEDLSGAGVAFMVAKALSDQGKIPAGQEKWLLDLAMIGIICDSMVLRRDNRIICKYGMLVLSKTRNLGLRELMRVAGVRHVSAETIGFQIGPRLNAAGRMETAELSLKLLLTESKIEAARIAAELDRLNAERRQQQRQAVSEISQSNFEGQSVIVAKGKWHEGIVGIIAGRLTEQYKKPSFVLTEVEDGLKGSGRSFGEFNLAEALKQCEDTIISGGGHAAACGLKIESQKYDDFVTEVNRYYDSLNLRDQERFLVKKEDLTLTSFEDLNLDLMEEMTKLEPLGEGNPEPVFLLENVFVLDATKMGTESQHLRMLVRDNKGRTMKLVAFNAPKTWLNVSPGAEVSVEVSLTENEWNGTRSVEGRILELYYF